MTTVQNAQTLSMRAFCKNNGLERTKVSRWCKDKGYETSNGVTPELAALIADEFQPNTSAMVTTVETSIVDVDARLSSMLSNPSKPLNGNALNTVDYKSINDLSVVDLVALGKSRVADNDHIVSAINAKIAQNDSENRELRFTRVAVTASNDVTEEALIRARQTIQVQESTVGNEKNALLAELQRQQSLQ